MTATVCDLFDFVDQLRDSVPPLHPSATCTINEWLSYAHCAALNNNPHEFARRLAMVREKVAIELHWEAEQDEELGDLVTATALHATADRWDANARRLLYAGPRRRRRRKLAHIKIPLAAGRRKRMAPPTATAALLAAGSCDAGAVEPTPPATEDLTMSEQHAANVAPPTFTEQAPQPDRAAAVRDMGAVATPEHLAKSHQRVKLRNTDREQTHFVRDRAMNFIEFRPGQEREIDMVVDELQGLLRLARTDRGYYESGPNKGKPFPAHPVRVIGLGPAEGAAAQTV